MLVLFGAGTVLGTVLGGRWADKNLPATLQWGLTLLTAALLALALFANHPAVAVPLIAVFGVSAFVINPALQTRAMNLAEGAPTLASSANISAFNIGNAIGPLAGAAALTAGTDPRGTIAIGAGFVAVGLLVAACTTRLLTHLR